MTDKQYAAYKRAAYAAKKLEAGQITALAPADLELIKSLLKDTDGYKQQALAEKRTDTQVQQDVDRCNRVLDKYTAALCPHGKPLCRQCEEEFKTNAFGG
jgi:hypothetical protein